MIVIMSAKTANSAPPHTVAVVVYDGLGHFGLAVAGEIFGIDHAVAAEPPWYRLLVCGAGASVVLDNGLRLEVPYGLDELERADTVLVPSCEAPGGPPTAVLAALRRAHARGARLVSLCTGAFVLAAAGLLDGRRVTTHWADCAELAARHPALAVDPDVLYVDDGDILTSAGSAAAIDLCLHLVRRDRGAEAAVRVARELVVPPFRDGGQAQYIETPLPELAETDLFADTVAWLQQHLDEPVTVADLAGRAAMSRRTFARRFAASTGTTPYQWLLRQRLQRAQRLLETTDLPVDTVARHSGLVTAANLRKHFTRAVRTTPLAYRNTFRARADRGGHHVVTRSAVHTPGAGSPR
jgi:AraC family transcriptional regulator, transcriptional activator FtrA